MHSTATAGKCRLFQQQLLRTLESISRVYVRAQAAESRSQRPETSVQKPLHFIFFPRVSQRAGDVNMRCRWEEVLSLCAHRQKQVHLQAFSCRFSDRAHPSFAELSSVGVKVMELGSVFLTAPRSGIRM